MIVADSNLIAYLHLPGPKAGVADAVLMKDSEWWVPPLNTAFDRKTDRALAGAVGRGARCVGRCDGRGVGGEVESGARAFQPASLGGCGFWSCDHFGIADFTNEVSQYGI
jgi:hypothetical protein